ncbi:MAG: bifunctional precorrin-2 dehydrogenase/sirohydrochlorin ferrochelatase [Desulfitobacteriaceae bacterium]|nr:bifunctional precorrin-2 dehydrogenase/sirohydrochlorin ferrochelatase [Desulfitobacteriaceae bacterium]
MSRKKCTVIGGGVVAQRKVSALLSAGANVWVVSPQISPVLQDLGRTGEIRVLLTTFQPELLKESFLVIAATNRREINQQIAAFCRENRILVNVTDCQEESDFITNAFHRQGDLMMAVSTNGKSPYLASKISADLADAYGKAYADLLKILGEARADMKRKEIGRGKMIKVMDELLGDDLLQLLQRGNVNEAREKVRQCLLQ